jgi:hypothetical protein
MELAPCPAYSRTGCQGFAGPLPSAFLDKQVKELLQRYAGCLISKIFFQSAGIVVAGTNLNIPEQAAPYFVIIFIDSKLL